MCDAHINNLAPVGVRESVKIRLCQRPFRVSKALIRWRDLKNMGVDFTVVLFRYVSGDSSICMISGSEG